MTWEVRISMYKHIIESLDTFQTDLHDTQKIYHQAQKNNNIMQSSKIVIC